MNFQRKSTVGWSIGNILLDLLGGVLNFGQMGVQSIDQGVSCILQEMFSSIMCHYSDFPITCFYAETLVNFYGNFGKTLLSLVCKCFLFFHFAIYIWDARDIFCYSFHIIFFVSNNGQSSCLAVCGTIFWGKPVTVFELTSLSAFVFPETLWMLFQLHFWC